MLLSLLHLPICAALCSLCCRSIAHLPCQESACVGADSCSLCGMTLWEHSLHTCNRCNGVHQQCKYKGSTLACLLQSQCYSVCKEHNLGSGVLLQKGECQLHRHLCLTTAYSKLYPLAKCARCSALRIVSVVITFLTGLYSDAIPQP